MGLCFGGCGYKFDIMGLYCCFIFDGGFELNFLDRYSIGGLIVR